MAASRGILPRGLLSWQEAYNCGDGLFLTALHPAWSPAAYLRMPASHSHPQPIRARRLSRMLGCLLALGCSACAGIPDGRYGVEELAIQGNEQMDASSLKACLATAERDSVELGPAALGSPTCGEPPFQQSAGAWELWSWPWTKWPVFDRGVFDQDLRRIERWYQARGFYDAEVEQVYFTPEAARYEDSTTDSTEAPKPCDDAEGGCTLRIAITVHEGQPVHVDKVTLENLDEVSEALQGRLRNALRLREGERFDEAYYERTKARLLQALEQAAYAKAEVKGRVVIDRSQRTARIQYTLQPGPKCVFGEVTVEGTDSLPEAPIRKAALIDEGDPYSQAALTDAQKSIYALGSFSAVRVEPITHPDSTVVDVRVSITPLRQQRFRVGAGIMSGILGLYEEVQSVPQWDVHLLFGYENKNLFGGLRRLNIEDRPRLIFLNQFPSVSAHENTVEDQQSPTWGNLLKVDFYQPGFLEPRTTLFWENKWDYGPDPFLAFFRHDLSASVGLRRGFFEQRLQLSFGLQQDYFRPEQAPEVTPEGVPNVPSQYTLPMLIQSVQLDLLDDARQPSKGMHVGTSLQEGLHLGYGSWRYLRVLPNVSFYIPLPFKVVFATRFAIGYLHIFQTFGDLDEISAERGPQNYRFRGGGATSNRGFRAGTLGVGIEGGNRLWEASAELRIPLMSKLTMALFTDVGDISVHATSDDPQYRFDHPNTSVGFGIRYRTLVGPIRLDLGWRVPGAQVIGGTPEEQVELGALPSAFHLTIGEAF